MKHLLLLLSLQFSISSFAQSWQEFQRVPDSTRTKVWWFHGETETTREGITADLEAYKRAGVGGVVYYDQVHGNGENALPAFSPEWWQMFVFAASEAHRLGLSFETHLSNGYVGGGPWVTESDAMKYLVSADTLVQGGTLFSDLIPIRYDRGTYRGEVATLAFPVNPSLWQTHTLVSDTSLTEPRPAQPICLVKNFGQPVTVRSLSYVVTARGRTATRTMNIPGAPADSFYGANYIHLPPLGELEVSDDGINYRKVCLVKPRYAANTGWSRQTISFPAVNARYFRLNLHDWSADPQKPETIRLSDVTLSARPMTDLWEEKAGLVSNHIFGNDTPEYAPSEVIHASDVVNLSDKVDAQGRLTWNVPHGSWVIIRFVCAPTGGKTRHGRKNLLGLECDKMSAAAAQLVWDHYFKVMDDTLRAHRLKFDGLAMDSHEAGAQNWTIGFEHAFRKLRGYDLTSYLPVMAGYVVDSRKKTDGVLYDVRRTIADLISSEYYGTLDSLCRQQGTPFTAQAIGNGLCIVGDPIQAKSHVTRPESEFWHYQAKSNYDIKECSSAAHLYGKPIASAEAFTDARYSDPLADIKCRADHAWCFGINEFVVCASAYQPWLNRFPGNTANGREYCLNRNNTYWSYSKPFWDYQARGNYMMRQGRSVADLCIFLGADAPIKIESYRLPRLPQGYDWDAFTEDALFTRMDVANGRITLPDGMTYRMMVLPREGRITLSQLKKISDLTRRGMLLYGEKPVCSPSGSDADSLATWQQLADEMWDTTPRQGERTYGSGRIYCGMSLEQACRQATIAHDMSFVHSPSDSLDLRFAHRQTASTDIYVLDNHTSQTVRSRFAFRTTRHYAQLWDPVSGLRQRLEVQNGSVGLSLAPNQTVFVVWTDQEDNLLPYRNTIADTVEICGQWTVTFDPRLGGNGQNTFLQLTDWTSSTVPGIRYYSGTAVYDITFSCPLPRRGQRVSISFPRLCDIASVEINGKQAGIVWCSPWELDVTGYLKKGKNRLRLYVTNSLNNRMVLDASLPASQRITYAEPPIRTAQDHLTPSGIIGKVQLMYR